MGIQMELLELLEIWKARALAAEKVVAIARDVDISYDYTEGIEFPISVANLQESIVVYDEERKNANNS